MSSDPIILIDTKNMTTEEWEEARQHGPDGSLDFTIGGSDVAALFGLSPWITELDLWLEKTGRKKRKIENPYILEMGHLLEPIIGHFYGKVSGNKVISDTYMYQHCDFPYMLANCDFRYEDKKDGSEGILECKSTSYHKAEDWSADRYPAYYEMQLRFYLGTLNRSHGSFAAMWGTNVESDFAFPRIIRMKAKEDMIYERCEEFIWKCRKDVMPKMEESSPAADLALKALASYYEKSNSKLPTLEFPQKYEGSLREIAKAQKEIKKLEESKKELEGRMNAMIIPIAEIMAAHEHAVLETTNDKLLIDFVTKTSKRVNSDLLKKTHPDVYKDVLKESNSRKLKVSIA